MDIHTNYGMRAVLHRIAVVAVVTMLVIAGLLMVSPLAAQQYFSSKSGLALKGYDVVSYHEEGKAVRGSSSFQERWGDAVWYFASAENAERFAADPEKYAPEYGGYCAYAAANDAIAPIDPEAFTIVEGKLYLNFSHSVRRRWNRNHEEYIKSANRNWPKLRAQLE